MRRKAGVGARHPMAEGEASDKYGNTGKDRIEDVERAHCADADEVKQSALDAEISKGLMQALEDAIAASCGLFCHKPLAVLSGWWEWREAPLDAP